VSALNQIFEAPSDLSYFSVSQGYTYHRPVHTKPTGAAPAGAPSQPSKEGTPMQGVQFGATAEKATATSTATPTQAAEDTESGARTVREALRMTLQFGKEYTDNITLVGEPGSFRFSKNSEAAATQTKAQPSSTPGQSRAASAVPSAASNPPAVGKASKSGDKVPSMPQGPTKPKRRKSKASEPSP
jgi:mediator of RNA polymerase II transcription subunit 6